MSFKTPESFRIVRGDFATQPGDAFGMFLVRRKGNPAILRVIASGGHVPPIGDPAWGWDHVSVSRTDRCPNWDEMCLVKSLFWDDEDPVVQLHPPRSQWVNNHKFCLHLWRPTHLELPLPPSHMVGYKEWGELV